MNQPGAEWDGRRWVSADGLWAWSGSQWFQLRSNLPIAARMAVYAGAGLAINSPILFVLILFWGLQGPGWIANPPDLGATLIQIGLTAAGALLAFGASWFLARIDRRDWWLGAVFAWPWVASAAGMFYVYIASQPQDSVGLLVTGCLLLFVSFPLGGSIVGSRTPPEPTRLGSTPFYRALKAIPNFLKALVKVFVDLDSPQR